MVARQPNDVARTLDRGLQVLELLAGHPNGLTMAEVATSLGLDRTVVHRLVRTLAAHRLVAGDEHKRYRLSVGLIRLAQTIRRDLRSVAIPVLEELAATTRATANIAIPDGDEVIVLATVEPRQAQVHVAYRAGQSHPLTAGSAGLAILAGRPPRSGERAEVTRARSVGYAISHEEIVGGTWGVSAPLTVPGRRVEASVGVSLFDGADLDSAGEQVCIAARKISEDLV